MASTSLFSNKNTTISESNLTQDGTTTTAIRFVILWLDQFIKAKNSINVHNLLSFSQDKFTVINL